MSDQFTTNPSSVEARVGDVEIDNRDMACTWLHVPVLVDLNPWDLLRNVINNLSLPEDVVDGLFQDVENFITRINNLDRLYNGE